MSMRFNLGSAKRTASPPVNSAVSACGWFELSVDRNNYSCVFSLEEVDGGGGNYIIVSTDADGTTLSIFADGGGTTLGSLTVGVPVFWGVTSVGSGAGNTVGYFRALGSNTFTVITVNRSSALWTSGAMWVGGDNKYGQPSNGKSRAVKTWDRSISAAEMLIESFFDKPMFPASLHAWYRMDSATDSADYSGNGRTLTLAGTLATEDMGVGLWRPDPLQFFTASAPPPPVAQVTHRDGIALSTISAINGITKASVSAVNGLTI